MFKTDPQKLLIEIEAAEEARDTQIERLTEMRRHYTGYEGKTETDAWPENHYYEYLGLTTSKVVHYNPRVRGSSRKGGAPGQVAEALQFGLNRWAVDYDLRKKLVDAYVDQSFAFGIQMVTVEPRPGARRDPSSPHWPAVTRIAPSRFFMDPKALSFDETRFQGHRWVKDHDDLIKFARKNSKKGWNVDAVKNLSPDIETDKIGRDPKAERDGAARNEIVGYEVWVPEYTEAGWPGAKEGFHGGLFTLAVAQHNGKKKADYIRKPRPAYVPRWGPYTMYGAYPNPDSVWPLAPFQAIWSQLSELNEIVLSANESGKKYKRIVLYDSRNKDLGDKLKMGEHDFVLPVSGLMDMTGKAMFVATEIGGITDQINHQIAMARERVDRNSGITDANRGNVTGDATATENAIADDAGTRRLDIPKQNFNDSVTRVLKTAAYFMYHDDRIVFPLDEQAGEATGMQEPWFYGGEHDPDSGYTFDDLELELEPFSMEKTGDAFLQQQVMGVIGTVTAIRDLVLTSPPGAVDAKPLLALAGQAHNFTGMDRVLNMEVLAQGMPQQEQQGEKGPRLAKSVKNTAGGSGGGGQLGGFKQDKIGTTNGQAKGRALAKPMQTVGGAA